MAGGFWSGIAAGLVVAGLGLAAASLMGPQPAGNAPPRPPQVEAPGVAGGDLAAGPAPAGPGVATAPERAGTTGPVVPGSAPPDSRAAGDLAPAARPATAEPEPMAPPPIDAGTSPATPAAAALEALAEAPPPVLERPGEEAAPALASAPSRPVPRAPAAPATPSASDMAATMPDAGAAAALPPTGEPPAVALPAVAAEEGPGPAVADPAPAPAAGGAATIAQAASPEEAPPTPSPAEAPSPSGGSVPTPGLPVAEVVPPILAPAPAPPPAEPPPSPPARPERPLDPAAALAELSGPEAAAPDVGAEQEAVAIVVEEPPATPGLLTLEGGALPGGDAVPVLRPGADAEAEEPAEEPQAEEEEPADPRALVRFAGAFEAPDGSKPLLSLILLDDPAIAGAEAAVASLPFPVSVAIDPARPGAAERMAAYRSVGIEVLALVELPTGAQPVDAAVAYEGVFAALPQTVAVLDLGQGGLGGGSATAGQALSRLAEDGRGAVLAEEGLGTALREADAAGVPAAALLRDLDGEGQDGRVIRRFLDDAARRAGQEGSVVLLARVRPETLSALALWGNARRAQEVAIVPISALLLASQPSP